jgi:hypothetical protein
LTKRRIRAYIRAQVKSINFSELEELTKDPNIKENKDDVIDVDKAEVVDLEDG